MILEGWLGFWGKESLGCGGMAVVVKIAAEAVGHLRISSQHRTCISGYMIVGTSAYGVSRISNEEGWAQW